MELQNKTKVITLNVQFIFSKFLSAIGEHIWVLTGAKDKKDNTIETVTRVKNRALPDKIEIENERIWSSDMFVSKVMGE